MAVRVSGANQKYTATNGLPTTVYTFCAWIRPATVGTTNKVLYWLTASGDVFTGIEIRDVGPNLMAYDSTTYAFSGLGTLVASANTWYRVALVVNGANATFYRSAAGSALGSASATDFNTPASPSTWYIGDDPYDEFFDGRIAAVKIWSAALTQAEVEWELSQYVPKRTANLLRWHPFVKAETTDYSGSANTLSGGSGTATEDGPPIPWEATSPRIVRIVAAGVARDLDANGTAAASATGSAAAGRPLDAKGTSAASADATLSVARPVDGPLSAAAHAAADSITRAAAGAGSVAGSAALDGQLSAQRPVDGQGTATAGAAGLLALERPLATQLAAAAEATAAASMERPLGGEGVAAAELAGTSTLTLAFAGSAAAAAAAEALAVVERAMDTAASAAAEASATLDTSALALLGGSGDAAATLLGEAALGRPLAGMGAACADLAGAADLDRPFAGQGAAAAAADAAVGVDRPVVGLVDAASGCTGDLTTSAQVDLDAAAPASALLAGVLGVTRALAGGSVAATTAAGDTVLARACAGAGVAAAVLVGLCTRETLLTGNAAVAASVTASLTAASPAHDIDLMAVLADPVRPVGTLTTRRWASHLEEQ